MWVCSLRVKRGTGRAFSLTLAYCFIQTSEVEEQLNKRLHARANQARLLKDIKIMVLKKHIIVIFFENHISMICFLFLLKKSIS